MGYESSQLWLFAGITHLHCLPFWSAACPYAYSDLFPPVYASSLDSTILQASACILYSSPLSLKVWNSEVWLQLESHLWLRAECQHGSQTYQSCRYSMCNKGAPSSISGHRVCCVIRLNRHMLLPKLRDTVKINTHLLSAFPHSSFTAPSMQSKTYRQSSTVDCTWSSIQDAAYRQSCSTYSYFAVVKRTLSVLRYVAYVSPLQCGISSPSSVLSDVQSGW